MIRNRVESYSFGRAGLSKIQEFKNSRIQEFKNGRFDLPAPAIEHSRPIGGLMDRGRKIAKANREVEALVDDRDVFNTLFERHGPALSAFLRGLSGNGHEAEDVFQDVAARAWKALKTNAKPRHERAWLLTIAYRAFLDHRAKNPEAREFREEEHFRSSTRRDREGDPVALAELAENKRRIDAAVAELSEPLRAVVLLHYTGGLSLREAAETLEISVGTVKSRLNAALEQLRRRLA